MSSSSDDVQSELNRRHKAAATTVVGLAVAAILMAVVAYLGRQYFLIRARGSVDVDIAARIVIFILGVGAIVWRRTKFSAMRLKDIAALQGANGLIRALEKTSLQVAMFAAAIVAVGFIATVLMGNEFYTYAGSLIALVVLLLYYPTKSSWARTVARFTEDSNNTPPPPPLDFAG